MYVLLCGSVRAHVAYTQTNPKVSTKFLACEVIAHINVDVKVAAHNDRAYVRTRLLKDGGQFTEE